MSNNLKIIRRHRGLTQYQLGVKAGHAPGSAKANVSRDEKKDTFQSHLAKKYAAALACSADDIFADNLDIGRLGAISEKSAPSSQTSSSATKPSSSTNDSGLLDPDVYRATARHIAMAKEATKGKWLVTPEMEAETALVIYPILLRRKRMGLPLEVEDELVELAISIGELRAKP